MAFLRNAVIIATVAVSFSLCHAAEADVNFNYYKNGNDWPDACATGKQQSPIAWNSATPTTPWPVAARSNLEFPVVDGLHIANNGHTVVVSWDSSTDSAVTLAVADNEWGAVLAGGGAGNLTRVPLAPVLFHIHTTCEHIIDGNLCALEIHLVTKVDNTTGVRVPEKCNQETCLAVFGTIFQLNPDPLGPGSSKLDTFFKNLPTQIGAPSEVNVTTSMDLNTLFPEDKTYVAYAGSLTTPGCGEGVAWHVFPQNSEYISAAQLDALQSELALTTIPQPGTLCPNEETAELEQCPDKFEGGRTNNREIQALNGRTLYVSADPNAKPVSPDDKPTSAARFAAPAAAALFVVLSALI